MVSFEDAQILAIHDRRKTVQEKDILLAICMRGYDIGGFLQDFVSLTTQNYIKANFSNRGFARSDGVAGDRGRRKSC